MKRAYKVMLMNSEDNSTPPCNAPVNDVAPALQYGNLDDGDSIVITDGDWSGDAPINYTYQWLRDGVAVVGETTQAYIITSADHDTEISCRVTGTNDCGSASALSDSVLIPSAP
jgi:hypothetical protein